MSSFRDFRLPGFLTHKKEMHFPVIHVQYSLQLINIDSLTSSLTSPIDVPRDRGNYLTLRCGDTGHYSMQVSSIGRRRRGS